MTKTNEERLLRAVGRRISELRRAKGVTQEQFAALYGCSVKYVQGVERGAENLSLITMLRLAEELDCEVADLLVAPSALTANPGRPRKK